MRYNWFAYMGLCLVLLFSAGCATGESTISPAFHEVAPDTVALVEVSGDIRGNAAKNQVEDFFTAEMLKKGYRVIERNRVNQVLDEQDFQRSERTSDSEAAQIGQVLNVPAVVMVNAGVDGEKVSITGRMVDAQTGEVLWIGTSRGGSGARVSKTGGAVLGAIAGSQIGGGRGRIVGGVAGGVLGGAAGESLSPQAARVVQKAIEEIVAELPER